MLEPEFPVHVTSLKGERLLGANLTAMKDDAGGLPPTMSRDGVHPLPAGFAVMALLAEAGIEKALKGRGQ